MCTESSRGFESFETVLPCFFAVLVVVGVVAFSLVIATIRSG
jgi:hypothetical protein